MQFAVFFEESMVGRNQMRGKYQIQMRTQRFCVISSALPGCNSRRQTRGKNGTTNRYPKGGASLLSEKEFHLAKRAARQLDEYKKQEDKPSSSRSFLSEYNGSTAGNSKSVHHFLCRRCFWPDWTAGLGITVKPH
jgi:hypothetical protein